MRAVAFGLVLALATTPALAGKPAPKLTAKKAAAPKPAAAARKAPSPNHGAPKERSAATPVPAASSSDSSDNGESGGDAAPTGPATPAPGGKVKSKSYSFGAMDVEGKLKTPQLLYFLNRVKLELDMSAPDKRSFMKELQQSADDRNL
jgi:hypothetical protein